MIAGLYKTFEYWSEQGTVWIYSDPHFSDEEVRYFDPLRPTDDELVVNINRKVGKYDTLIMLGDIGNTKYVSQLKGNKVLICGNHDAGVSNYIRKTFKLCLDKEQYTRDQALEEARKEFPRCQFTCVLKNKATPVLTTNSASTYIRSYWDITADNNLFNEVYEGPLVIGEKLILSHEPVNLPYMFNIHGHIHDRDYKGDSHHLNCVAEAIDYKPVNLNQLMKKGLCSKVDSIHRITIDNATARSVRKDKV